MRLLLDEHVALAVALAVARGVVSAGIEAVALRDWQSGAYFQLPDDVILQAAHAAGWIMVTYDMRTIPPLLKGWGEQGRLHGGVVLVDDRTIAPSDVGGLVRALVRLASQLGDVEWENRVVYLTC